MKRQQLAASHHRHTLVLISRWAFPQLAFRLLHKLDQAYMWTSTSIETPLVDDDDGSGGGQGGIANMLSAGYSQILLWPAAVPGTTASLPFFGEIFKFPVPMDVQPAYGSNLSLNTAFVSVSLVSKLGPVGLLQNIWALWELCATGKDILVFGSSPTQCSDVAVAIASLLAPLSFTGDVRPFMVAQDCDAPLLQNASKRKKMRETEAGNSSGIKSVRDSSIIVGTTDPDLLITLGNFDAVIFLSTPPPTPSSSPSSPTSSSFPASSTVEDHGTKSLTVAKLRDYLRSRNGAALKVVPHSSTSTFWDIYAAWAKTSSGGGQKSNIVCRVQPSVLPEVDLLNKIQQMDSLTSMRVLGDQLLRDGLKTITLAYFKQADGVSLEVAEMRAAALEKARVTEEQMRVEEEKKNRSNEANRVAGARGALHALFAPLSSRVQGISQLLLNDMPSVFLWLIYLVSLYLYFRILRMPLIALAILLFLIRPPMLAPKPFERLLRRLIPLWVLYPTLFAPDGTRRKQSKPAVKVENEAPAAPAVEATAEGQAGQKESVRCDLSGVWKRVRTINYEAFLGAQGANFIKRKLGSSIPLTHTITMDAALTRFRLQEKGGPIDTDYTYTVEGKEKYTVFQAGTDFLDTVSWDKNVLSMRKLYQPTAAYELITHRHLDDANHLRVTAVFRDLKTKQEVSAVSFFELAGPSPNPIPEEDPDDLPSKKE